MRSAATLLLATLALPLQASTWSWSDALTVNTARSTSIFPHIESANRRPIAVSGETVGVVWEDNRDGVPHCYFALKSGASFSTETRLSGAECYEPAIAALPDGRFVAAWEEGGRVHAQVLPGGKAVALTAKASAQATLVVRGAAVYAAWAEEAGRHRRIVVGQLAVAGNALHLKAANPVEAAAPADEQGWPALAVAGDGTLVVAWEDRRHRHTVPMVSHSKDGLRFAPPARLSDHRSGSVDGLGAGIGAMRPTLAAWGDRGVVAAWLDKRDFLSGYDVYAAFDTGTRRFGQNLQVQDSFGDNMAQWHAQVVANTAGRAIALWDDARDGTPDVWLSEWDGAAFGDDFALPAASGPGEQSDPAAAFDAAGRLHVVWLERDASGTRIRYALGTPR